MPILWFIMVDRFEFVGPFDSYPDAMKYRDEQHPKAAVYHMVLPKKFD